MSRAARRSEDATSGVTVARASVRLRADDENLLFSFFVAEKSRFSFGRRIIALCLT